MRKGWPGKLQIRRHLGERLERRLLLLSPSRRQRFELTRATVDRLVSRGDIHALDAGCGDGLLAEAVARQNPTWEIVGIDSSTSALARAQSRIADTDIYNIRFVEANVTEPIRGGPYDVIFAIECLEEIDDDRSALRSLAAALAPEGILLVHVPERDWRPILPGSSPTWRHEVRHGYSRTELTDQIEEAGLAVLEVRDSYHRLVQLAQEIRDRIKATPAWLRALAFPLMVVAVRLEAAGLRWGRGQALFAVAVRSDSLRHSFRQHELPGPGNELHRPGENPSRPPQASGDDCQRIVEFAHEDGMQSGRRCVTAQMSHRHDEEVMLPGDRGQTPVDLLCPDR